MHKVSDVLAERFSQDPLEIYFSKQHPPGAYKDYDFDCPNTFRNQKIFKPIATGQVSDENINFETDNYKQNNPRYPQKFQAAIRYLATKPTEQVS